MEVSGLSTILENAGSSVHRDVRHDEARRTGRNDRVDGEDSHGP